MSTTIITLLRSKERLENSLSYIKTIEGAENYDLVSIFPAVDASDEKQVDSIIKRYYTDDMLDIWKTLGGCPGCLLSHFSVIERFIKRGHRYGIILEDDFKIVRPLPKNDREIEDVFRKINVSPKDVDILFLNNRVVASGDNKVLYGCGLEGYIITQHGARKLAKLLMEKRQPTLADIKIIANSVGCLESPWFANIYQADRVEGFTINAYKSKDVYVALRGFTSTNANIK